MSRPIAMTKGESTREMILTAGVALAREIGVSSLTIGTLSDKVGMSKSGLFAHFGSKEELQLAVLKSAQDRFSAEVLLPAYKEARGLARLRAVFSRWLVWSGGVCTKSYGGCLILAANHEYDDRPGPVRDLLAIMQRTLISNLSKSVQFAIDSGELPEDTNPLQFAFELFGLVLSAQLHTRLLHDQTTLQYASIGFERLIAAPPLFLQKPAVPTPAVLEPEFC